MTVDPQRLKELFLHAAEISSPSDRAAFLERECGSDAELRRKLEALLHAHDDSGGFLAPGLTSDEAPHQENSDAPGDVIGPYKLLQKLGEGGMGTVWIAEQQQPVKRRVALKLIKPGMDSHQVLRRFEAERQALALMDHPNIAKVLDAGCTMTGRPYFVMELVKGTPITTYCDEQRLPLSRRLELFVSLCQAIQHAHQTVSYRLHKFLRRHKGGVAAAMAIVLVAGIGVLAELDSLRALNKASEQYSELQIDRMLLLNFLEAQVLHGREPRNPNRTLRQALDQASENVADYCQGQPRTEARARKILGVAYMDMGADRPAEIQLTKAVQLDRQVLDLDLASGRFDEGNLSALSALASLYASQKRFDEEEPLRVEVVEHYRRRASKFPSSDVSRHNRTCALDSLGNCYLHQARWQQAETLFAEVIQECRGRETAMNQILDKDHLLSRSLAGHAQCLLARNAFAEAEEELRECVSLMNRESPDSKDRKKAESLLAEARARQRK